MEMAYQLRAITALLEDLGSILSTNIVAYSPSVNPVPWDPMPSSDIQGHQECKWYTNSMQVSAYLCRHTWRLEVLDRPGTGITSICEP
ncbi:hypothetical protein LEMLEM_LOCUS22372, partial [Lemmus lemmus]